MTFHSTLILNVLKVPKYVLNGRKFVTKGYYGRIKNSLQQLLQGVFIIKTALLELLFYHSFGMHHIRISIEYSYEINSAVELL
jgi:hypothetical protein